MHGGATDEPFLLHTAVHVGSTLACQDHGQDINIQFQLDDDDRVYIALIPDQGTNNTPALHVIVSDKRTHAIRPGQLQRPTHSHTT
jgi:hypothetical protein